MSDRDLRTVERAFKSDPSDETASRWAAARKGYRAGNNLLGHLANGFYTAPEYDRSKERAESDLSSAYEVVALTRSEEAPQPGEGAPARS